jgi:glucose/mannose-6-phosphate isomerase
MFEATAGLPEQVAAAVHEGRDLEGMPDRERVENVVAIGMGGSGIACDILVATAAPFMPVPVTVVKSYECPAFVGDGTLVFAISFSGETEETIEATTQAAVNGARVVVVTTGGELAKLAGSWGAPVVSVPLSIPWPRAGVGAMAIPPLLALESIGLFPVASQWVASAVRQLQRRRDAVLAAGEHSLPAAMARRIGRTIPLVHGAGEVGSTAARRWKTQVNENAKAPAFWASQPELCHNEVAGWGQHGDITRQVMTLVNLRHDGEHPQVVRRFAMVADLVQEVVADIVEVRGEGEGDLAQLLDLVLLGDFTSLYMASQEGIDPGPVPALISIKRSLQEG